MKIPSHSSVVDIIIDYSDLGFVSDSKLMPGDNIGLYAVDRENNISKKLVDSVQLYSIDDRTMKLKIGVVLTTEEENLIKSLDSNFKLQVQLRTWPPPSN